jgi:hypothetical protein
MRELAETHVDEPAAAEAPFDWYQSAAFCRPSAKEPSYVASHPRRRATVHSCLLCLALPARRVLRRAESLCGR